jgi:hypothetical protein
MLRAEEKKTRWLGMDMRPRWRRRVAVIVTYFGFLVAISFSDERWWGHPMIATMVLVLLVQFAGVFRMSGPLKSFEDSVTDRPQGWMIVNGLDEWARYRYGAASFDEATEKQQADLLKRYRVGNFKVPRRSAAESLDERERQERDGAVRWSMRWVAMFLASAAGRYAATKHSVTGMEVATDFLMILVLVWTLPQARVLWTERDPREIAGDMALVQSEA